ncbi:erythromycin esterase family protein [Usitatibacter palustris]|uniref:Erythromycin esterase n=1 Tax=Usitatibacter palustris TaxID=2732487 RepID=A0A6M4HAV5_9PROT|nr:erythromycin esterase family protein [Usitatibacter palustris]QJR16691.1 hypothetical protein DSM104440_03527 [Usitatibacter palustris]
MAAAAPATAADFPAANLDFESWEDGRPTGWYRPPVSTSFTISPDCTESREGKCALKVSGGAANQYFPVSQTKPPGAAAGHRLKFSGWIRTRNLEGGFAGLWLRVDAADRRMMAIERMEKTGPRGTTEWQQFEIAIAVPPNAGSILIGVIVSGSGETWFDDLKLTVDTSVNVPKLELPRPPRPKPSQSLATDAELAIPAADVPRVSDALKADAQSRVVPIRSLFSDDFSDLQFLKPLLEGKRIVQLGESSHGVAEFNWMKARLVRFLHRELGFDVVAFESSLSGCDVADAGIGTKPPGDVMRDCIFSVWHSSETLGVFEYLDATRKVGQRISLAGFDTQNSGYARRAVHARLITYAALVDPKLGDRIEAAEPFTLRPKLSKEEAGTLRAAYTDLAEGLARNRATLMQKATRHIDIDLAIQEARSRVRLVDQLAEPDLVRSMPIRDEGMADNLDFIADRMFPGRKIIVWAHNGHIAKDDPNAPGFMGSHVARRRGQETYTVGLYMGRGMSAMNDRSVVDIAPPPHGSLEAIIASAGWRMGFVDFSRSPSEWMLSTVIARGWGREILRLVPAKAYDAVIYIDRVTPPDYQ